MLPRADIPSVRPVAYLEASTPVGNSTDARKEVLQRLNNISLGQQFEARILSQVKDNTFLVGINNTTARMTLPVGTKVGDSMSMTLVSTEPRMAFAVNQETGAEGAGAKATLSQAGRLIDNLLQSAEQKGMSTAIIGRTPLVETPSAAATQIAAALQNTVATSGLFYESHLQGWLEGNRSLTELMSEPQNKSGLNANSQANAADANRLLNFVRELSNNGRPIADLIREVETQLAGNKDSMRLLNVVREWTEGGRTLAELTQALKTPSAADALLRQDAVAPEAARLINQQLNALENQRILWQGELWPGQQMEWEISKDTPGNSKDEAEQSWNSVVRFELPSLGTVSATIKLVGNHVYMQVKADSETAAASLREHGSELINAMEAAGTPLDLLTVSQDAEI